MMTKLNNVDMTLNTNNPEEEMKMINLNNDKMMLNELNKEEKMMIELNEKREMLIAAIEEELTNEVVDMVAVGDYEEILAGVEYEIIELLNSYEEQIFEEEYKMEKAVELDRYVDEITPAEKEEEKIMNTTERTFGPLAGADTDGDVKHEEIITNLTQSEVRDFKVKYQESTKRVEEYVGVLMNYESYHGQMEWNMIAPALATPRQEPKGLSKKEATSLLRKEEEEMDKIVSYVSKELGLLEETIEEFMNE